MALSVERLGNYPKNLQRLQEATEELLSHMKGYDFSFRSEITDKKGDFSPEKLQALLGEMLSLWEDKLRKGKPIDPKTQKSKADSYIEARRELYRLYLSLVMRCSLYHGAYSAARNGSAIKERTDFAFLLEQAKWFFRNWCVTNGPKGRKNELMAGYDEHFGFHFYHPLQLYRHFQSVDNWSEDLALTPDWNTVWMRLEQLTDEGCMKQVYIQRLSLTHRTPVQEPEKESQEVSHAEADSKERLADSYDETDLEEEEEGDSDALTIDDINSFLDEDDTDSYDEIDLEEEEEGFSEAFTGDDIYPFLSEEERAEFMDAEWERRNEEWGRKYLLLQLVEGFKDQDQYVADCDAFVKLFEQAKPDVLWGFYNELEAIVNLYLTRQEIAPLANMDKVLDVYNRFYDGPLRQAKRYARGLKWKNL